MLIKTYHLYERYTGVHHTIDITFEARRCYEVRFDGGFYATAENMNQAMDEAVDIVINNNLTNINPI